jgi:hypothetical protein
MRLFHETLQKIALQVQMALLARAVELTGILKHHPPVFVWMDVTVEQTLQNLCLAVDICIAPAVHAHLIPWDTCHSLHEKIPTQRKHSEK